MLDRTDHPAAPWVLVEAEDKRRTRVKVVESVVEAVETGMAARNMPVPPSPRPRPSRSPEAQPVQNRTNCSHTCLLSSSSPSARACGAA